MSKEELVELAMKSLKLDDDKKKVKIEINKIKSEKAVVDSPIIDFMNKSKITDIATNDGVIKLHQKKSYSPITKKTLREAFISGNILPSDAVDKAVDYIMKQRKTVVKPELARKK